MPKQEQSEVTSVRIPMMPKGVEHEKVPECPMLVTTVRIPMMPKGVEHPNFFGSGITRLNGENSDDAERR